MTEWDPRDVMGIIQYARFKSRMWVEVDPPPDWVSNAADDYYRSYCDDNGHRPYDETKVFVGDSLKYKIEYRNYGEYGRKIRMVYYTKIK
jgi:hypothetical protein